MNKKNIPDILDYLNWRGDLTFEESAFNDIDAVILCQILYLNFDGIFKNSGFKDFIKISELAERFINAKDFKTRRCQIQHLKTAVFRSVENHVPSVRSTASGETCAIDSSGRIINKCASFTENYIIAEVPILNERHKITLYSKLKNILWKNKSR